MATENISPTRSVRTIRVTDTDGDVVEFTMYAHKTIVLKAAGTLTAITEDDWKVILEQYLDVTR